MEKNDKQQEHDSVDDALIDSLTKNEEKKSTLSIAEAAREKKWKYPSFAAQLFMGQLDTSHLLPFPEQSEGDKQIGDKLVKELELFLKENLDPDEVDRTGEIPDKVIEGLKELGGFCMKVPKEYGGLGLSQVNYNRAMMLIGSYCASTAVLVSAHQSIGVPEPLKLFGTEEQKRKFLPRFSEGAISAFALTEPNVGSDPAQMTTTATLDEDGKHYIINGDKLWCTNGIIADIIVVMALTEPKMVAGKERKQITAFILETNTPGIECLHRCRFMGLAGIQNGLLRFTNVRVPVENILWDKGRGLALALTTLNAGRLTIPAATTGVAKQCLAIARKWGNDRSQWGDSIGNHEFGRDKISYIAATTFAMEAVTWLTSHWADQKTCDIRIEAAMAKVFCSEACWTLVDTTLQLRGGRGYERADSLRARGEDPFPVERMMRDMRINSIIEGTTDILTLFIAREAMDKHLSLMKNVLKAKGPVGQIKEVGNLLGFYLTWYPRQWVHAAPFHNYDVPKVIEKRIRMIDRFSHRLARTLFHVMNVHKQKLQKRQMLLNALVNIGIELLGMSASCSYAASLHKQNPADCSSLALADFHCSGAERRVKEAFKFLQNNDVRYANKIGEHVLEGDMAWLEEGVMGID